MFGNLGKRLAQKYGYPHKPKMVRTRNGRTEVLCGGYVSWDGQKKDRHGYPERRQEEVRVWMQIGRAHV